MCAEPGQRVRATAHEVERGVANDAEVPLRAGRRSLLWPDVVPGDRRRILVYRDVNHITTEYMSWVAPAFGDLLGAPWTATPDSFELRLGPGR